MGVTHSGLALAGTPDAPDASNSVSGQAGPVETSADYLKPGISSAHRPSAQTTLSLPLPSAARPDFTPQRPSASAVVTSPPAASSPMFSPVPPPPPAAVTVTIPAQPSAPTMAESLLKPPVTSVASETTAEAPAAVSAPEPAAAAAPAPAMPEAVVPQSTVPEAIAADESVPAGYNSVFIDPTNYSLGATQAPTAQSGGAPNVVFAERSSGCQITVAAGQTSPSNACAATAAAAQGSTSSSAGQGEIRVGPVAVSSQGVRLGSTTIVSREALNEKLRPLNVLRRGNEEYVFPLSVPASISSLFGWRMHPIAQSWRFHSGTDLAAPLGTPVLATQAGRVSVSDFLGGYGLTVILRHGDGSLESRYAHLSQLAVQAGEWVEQGEVIGLVGSTGTSTGPHLHFEMRQLTADGWAAVDPIEVLEYGVANLLEIIDNPLLALGRDGAEAAATEESLPADYPFRPAQPNAS
ncbi:peptidoglycan DD-metalloendopeptidase family protein [Nodosilinea sp. AN01ver1]|uniref:M23 family metallopeptidase n=1 Tax=Nodosilinea sp. AN01ver1 TaxID=3423362 RepID=UPI003D318E43